MSSSASRTKGSQRQHMAHLPRRAEPSQRTGSVPHSPAGPAHASDCRTPCARTFFSCRPGFRAGQCPTDKPLALGALLHGAAALLLAIVLLVAVPARAAEVWLDVSKAAERKIVIALAPLAAHEGVDETTVRQVLENDLVMTGYFRLLPLGEPQLAQAEKERAEGKTDADAWKAFGAELLLRADSSHVAGRLVLRATLFDVGARSQLLSRDESDTPAEAPRLAHRLADAVLRAITGGPSLALTRIAATWSQGGSAKRVVIMDYDGRNQRPLSAEGVLALYPAWFPDGTRVAYVTYRKGRPEIVAQNVANGQVRSLAFFPGLNASPAISADGKQMLLVLSRDGNPEVYRMAVDGSELKRLTFTQAVETSPIWSPDGTQIALVSDQGGGPQIYLLGANGGRVRRASFMGNYSTSPDWSPRGDRIVFTSLIEGTFQLVLLDPVTVNQEQLTFDAEHKENPSFAPDGRHLVYSQGRGTAYRLMILDTLTGERFTVTREKGSYTSPAWSP